jgi:hypothetical protein
MSHATLGRADLLHIIAHLPEAEWPAAARAVGYNPLPPKPAEVKTGQGAETQTASAKAPPPPPAEPYRQIGRASCRERVS